MKAGVFFAVIVVLALVPNSLQYGTVFVDKVVPVKEDYVHITNTHSDTITAGTFQVQKMTLSDPGGFHVDLPVSIDVKSEDHFSLTGELGISLGGPQTNTLTLHADHDLTLLSEDFFFSANNINFSHENSVDFATHREFYLNADGFIDFDSSLLMALQSVIGDTVLTSPEIFATGPDVLGGAEQTFLIDSRTGFVNLYSELDTEIHADELYFRSQQRIELLSENDFFINAEDLVRLDGGVAKFSALGDLTIFSNRSVDVYSPSLVSATASHVSITAGDEILLTVTEDDLSQLTTFSKDTITFKALGDSQIAADNINFIASERVVVIANVLDWATVETIQIGSEATNNVDFDADEHFLEFTLLEDSGAELLFDASQQLLFNAINIVGFEGANIRIAGSTLVGAAQTTSFSAQDIHIASRSEISVDDNFFLSTNGQVFTIAKDLNVDARHMDYEAKGTISFVASQAQTYDAGHFIVLSTGQGDIIATAQSTLYSGGNTDLEATDSLVIRPQVVGGKNPDVSFSYFKDSDIYGQQYTINTSGDISYTTNFGDLNIKVLDDMKYTAVQELNIFTDGGASLIVHGGDVPFSAARDVSIRNGLVDSFDIASFTFGEDIYFRGITVDISSNQQILSSAGGSIFLTSLQGVEVTSTDLRFVTVVPGDGSGVNIHAKNDIVMNSDLDTTFDSANDLLVRSVTGFLFTTPLFEVSGTEDASFISGQDTTLDLTGTFGITSDGYVFTNAKDSLAVLVNTGALGFTAADSINSTTISYYDWRSTGNFQLTGGYVTSFSPNFGLTATNGKVSVAANSNEGSLTIKSHLDAVFQAATNLNFNAPEVSFTAGRDFGLFTDDGDITFNAKNSYLELQPTSISLSGEYDITAGSYSYSSFEFGAFYTGTASLLDLQAQNAVYITSDGDLSFAGPSAPFVARASNLWEAQSHDSSEFTAGGSLSITAPAGKHVTISSNGHTGFKSRTSNVNINSASYFDVDAGRIVMDAFTSGATFSAPNIGDIKLSSTYGSIRLESFGTITSNNEESHIFTSTSGVDMTANGGLYFYLEGALPGTADAIQFRSSDLYGDIVFDSELSGYTLVALKDVIYTAANNISLASAQGAQFLADTDITWNAPHGSFDVNGAAGISILAGNGVDPADVTFQQAKGAFQMLAGEQILFHSTGAVEQTAILISAVSDIRYSTGNSGDISFTASGLLDVFASGYFTAQATNNLNLESTTDAVTIDAVTGGNFESKGGPVRFSTLTNANGGAITLQATSGDLSFVSGNSTNFFARGSIAINSATGIGFTSVDGSIDVTAESATSFINLKSTGGLQVRSSGSRRVPEDGLIFQAANNIVFGTPTTKTIQWNAGNEYIVGEVSRPIITFNAGGNVGVNGFTIDSDGGIYTSSENDFVSDIGANLEVNTHFVIGAVAGGPFQLTAGKTMFVNANTGIAEMSAQTLYKLTSGDSVTGTTAGSLDLVSTGAGPNDQIFWSAPKVSITTGTHQLMATVLDGDLTNSFTLTTPGTGTIVGGLDSESHVLFDANTQFKATSGGLLSFITTEDNGPITFSTAGTGSDISLTTDVQSDVELEAGGQFAVFANTLSLTGDSFSLSAIDTQTHTDRTDGDVQIGAQSNIVAVAQQDLFVAGARYVLIQTVGSEAGVGAPISITATGDVAMNADGDFLIANVPQEGGSLAFSSLTDVLIENSDANAFVNVVSDANESFIATRDITTIVKQGFYTEAGDQFSLVANGRDTNDGFGIHWITTESLGADITFQAIFGSIRFTAGTSVSVTADAHPSDVGGHDIVVTTDHSGSFRGATGTTVTTANDVFLTSKQGRITLASNTGIEAYANTTPLQASPDITFEANGVDDNGDFSVRFREEGGFPIQINAVGDLTVDANEDIFFLAPTIGFAADRTMSFQSSQAAVLFDAKTATIFSDVIDYSGSNVVFETDYFHIDTDGGLNYRANAGDLVIETNGLHGNIDMYASATVLFTASNSNIDIVTARRPDADINIITSLARIEFNPTVNSNHEGFSIDFLAENGDLTFDGQGDDADVYVTVQSVVIEAESGISMQSLFPADPLVPAVIVNVDITNVAAESDFIMTGDVLQIRAPQVQFNSNPVVGTPSDYGVGGSTTLMAQDDIDVTAAVLTIATYTQGDLLVISSETSDINFAGTTANSVITISPEGVMRIPYNNNLSPTFNPLANPNICRDRELFAFDALLSDPINAVGIPFPVDGDNSWLWICVCDAGVPWCAPLQEPPCDPTDPNCPDFNFV